MVLRILAVLLIIGVTVYAQTHWEIVPEMSPKQYKIISTLLYVGVILALLLVILSVFL